MCLFILLLVFHSLWTMGSVKMVVVQDQEVSHPVIVIAYAPYSCHPPPHCPLFPPHEQWLVAASDMHGSALSCKPAQAEPKKAEPAWAVVMASQGPWLRP